MPGVVYITSMSRPDSALALAILYTLQSRGECRIGSVCVEGSGLGAATYCDIVYRFYAPGPPKNANEVLPTGFAITGQPDPPMVRPAIAAQYVHSVRKLSDTSQAESVIRNGVSLNAESVMILSAPASSLAKSLDITGAKDLYKERVKTLVIVDPQESPAMRRVMNDFPAPIVIVGKEVGDAIPYPGSTIATDFAWANGRHPVADACAPDDTPSYDVAAVLHAVRPNSGFFNVANNRLALDPGKKERILQTCIELATARPVTPVKRPRPPA